MTRFALLALLALCSLIACGSRAPRGDGSGQQCRTRGLDDCPQGTVCCSMRSESGNTRMGGKCVPAPSCVEAP